MKKKLLFVILTNLFIFDVNNLVAQPILETGGREMPNEWIDKDTHHKIVKLTRDERNDLSFYFHNNPFIGNEMVYYSSTVKASTAKRENKNPNDKQYFLLNLQTLKSERLTNHAVLMKGEIVFAPRKEVYYQVEDSIFFIDTETKKERLLYVFPADFKGDITTINADGTLLGGTKSCEEEKELFKKIPNKHDYFNRVYEAKFPRTLFTINVKSRKLTPLFSDSAWLNHVQFSPVDPCLLMFCHEGPWHKVDRIWTINVNTKQVNLIHKRTLPMEIAGHEWIGQSGKTIWFDLQQPRGSTFFIGGVDLENNSERKYQLARDDWSVHFTSSKDEKQFAGDGGDTGSVAKAKDGKWINLFTPKGDSITTEKLVNMKQHQYHLEPNVHFSPDGNWIIFRANFEGKENVYAVELRKREGR